MSSFFRKHGRIKRIFQMTRIVHCSKQIKTCLKKTDFQEKQHLSDETQTHAGSLQLPLACIKSFYQRILGKPCCFQRRTELIRQTQNPAPPEFWRGRRQRKHMAENHILLNRSQGKIINRILQSTLRMREPMQTVSVVRNMPVVKK